MGVRTTIIDGEMPEETRIRAGDRLGSWRVVTALHRGGMAALLLCRDESSGALVALKYLVAPPSLPVEYLVRFRREVSILDRIDHPHVVRVLGPLETYEFGLGFPLELVEGMDLAHHGRLEGPLPVAAAADLFDQLGSGIVAIHEAGIVHRDLKPANVMISREGILKIIDFGLSIADDLTRFTRSDFLIGTPTYMAPEQLACSREIDHRADQYGFGSMAYELLAGTVPYPRASLPKILAAKKEGPRPLDLLRPDLGPEWIRWIDGLMAYDPLDRYASMQEALDAMPRRES